MYQILEIKVNILLNRSIGKSINTYKKKMVPESSDCYDRHNLYNVCLY